MTLIQSSTPGNPAQPIDVNQTIAPLYVDGVEVNQLTALMDVNQEFIAHTFRPTQNEFWATPSRDQYSTMCDTLSVTIGAPKLINNLSFSLSKFPCQGWLQGLDTVSGKWVTLTNTDGTPATFTMTGSSPSRIYPGVKDSAHRHPHHRTAGHWQDYQFSLKPMNTAQVRIVLTRLPSIYAPVDASTGQPCEYSLAIKDFEFGYFVQSTTDVPQTNPSQVVANIPPFAASTDLLGSSVNFSLAQYSPEDIMWPALAAQDGQLLNQIQGANLIWRSGPQPFSQAVVNYFVDGRDGYGKPQAVDRFFIDSPINGPTFNIYYSNDDVSGIDFTASDQGIKYPALKANGSVVGAPNGVFFPDTTSYLDLRQQAIQPDFSKPWWMGLTLQPVFPSTDTGNYIILDSPLLTVQWINNAWQITVNGTSLSVGDTFIAGQSIPIVIGYDGISEASVYVDSMPVSTFNVGAMANSTTADTWRFGGLLGANPGVGNYYLAGLVFKQASLTSTDVSNWENLSPNTYLRPSDLGSDQTWDYTGNSLLRVLPFFQTPENPFGFVGGPGVAHDKLNWTPINRTYKLQRGFIHFNPISAAFWKFEFSNLAPLPYQRFTTNMVQAKVFTSDIVSASQGQVGLSEATPEAGTLVNQDSAIAPLYIDQSRNLWLANPGRAYDGYTPTEAVYSTDPDAAQRLSEINPAFRMQPWHSGRWMPRFMQTQVHYYQEVTVTPESNVAYFVALSSLRMYKVDYTVVTDTPDYLLPFYDNSLMQPPTTIGATPWSVTDPGITSPAILTGTTLAQSQSVILNSQSNVRGLQFATVQSEPLELINDPYFADPTMANWSLYGTGTLTYQSSLSLLGAMIKVERHSQQNTWNQVQYSDAPADTMQNTWEQVMVASQGDWFNLVYPPVEGGGGGPGGIQSAHTIQPSRTGRIYAAARVFTSSALSAPLSLEILDNNGAVLAREDIMPKTGGVTEWYIGWTIGSFDGIASPNNSWNSVKWSDFPTDTVQRTYADVNAMGTYDAISGVNAGYTGPVTVRVIQNVPTDDTWYMDSLALFEDPILWEFSNDQGMTWWPATDIKNDPDGCLLFPSVVGTLENTATASLMWRVSTYRPNQMVHYLYMRPWYDGHPLGVMPQESISPYGPNLNGYDQYPYVTDSPFFKAWDKPIPQTWFFAYRKFLHAAGISA